MELNNENISIYACQFEVYVQKAKVQIKFPCNYFLEWKANNGKVIVSSQNRCQANRSQILFKENLNLNVNILYDKVNKQYLKKQSLLMINLISKSRPDQIKLVGRAAIDLAEVLNENSFKQLKTSQLQYCSVQATMNFSIRIISVKQSSMHVSELDRSSFNQYMTFQSALKPNQQLVHRNQGSSTYRDFDEEKSLKGSQDRQIRSLGRDKNKMSVSSLTKPVYSPSNRINLRGQLFSVQMQNKMNRSSIERSNSIPVDMQTTNNMLTDPQILKSDAKQFNEANFSFHKINQSDLEIYGHEQNEQAIQLRTSQPYKIQKQNEKPIKTDRKSAYVNQQKQMPVNRPAIEKVKAGNLSMLSIKQTQILLKQQQQFSNKISEYENNMLEKDLIIKRLQTQAERQSILSNNSQHGDSSVQSAFRSTGNRFSMQIQKSNEQSKRIINLTEALCEFQNKYTKVTLDTQELRSNWKRQKDELSLTLTRLQNIINVKQREIKQKQKLNQLLKNNFQKMQKISNQKLTEIIGLKSQIARQKEQNQTVKSQKIHLQNQKIQLQENTIKLQNQIRLLSQLNSENQSQLNQSFAQRLSNYQKTINDLNGQVNELQVKLNKEMSQKKSFQLQIIFLKALQSQLQQKIISFQRQSRYLNAQVQTCNVQMFSLSQQKQQIRQKVARKQQQLKQMAEQLSMSKSQEISHILKQKQGQAQNIRQQLQAGIQKVEQQKRALQLIHFQWQKQLQSKVQNHQNTILTLSQQLHSYQTQIKTLKQSFRCANEQLNSIKQNHSSLSHQSKEQQKQKQEILFNLAKQLQQQAKLINDKHMEVNEIQQILLIKDEQLIKNNEELASCRAQIQIIKAKNDIYQRKLKQQQIFYQDQAEKIRLQNSQQVYQMEDKLQDQFVKYHQLQQLKQILKESLHQWQNKCTKDKIASSKVVGSLNDMIKQKQEVMNEMEKIMKTLQKDKFVLQQQILNQASQYQDVFLSLRNKQNQIRQSFQDQEHSFLSLYESVKQQRLQLRGRINQQQRTIVDLSSCLAQQNKKTSFYNQEIQGLKQSLKLSQQLVQECKAQSEKTAMLINNEHNQQLQEYEERIRQLESIIYQKDGEILQKQIIINEYEKNQSNLQIQLQKRQKQRCAAVQMQLIMAERIKAVKQQKQAEYQNYKAIDSVLKAYKQKLAQLQNTLLELSQKQQKQMQIYEARILELQNEKHDLGLKAEILNEQLLKQQQQVKAAQVSFIEQVQLLKLEQAQQIQQIIISQKLNQQSSLQKVRILEEEAQKQNDLFLQKILQLQTMTQEMNKTSAQLSALKSQRQTFALLNYKQHSEKLKSRIKYLQKQIIDLKGETNKIPSLERTIKIKNIEINSLKYKSTANYYSQSIDPDQVSHIEQIIQFKDQEIQSLQKQNQRVKQLELQIYQVQSLNQSLYQDIQQYEQEKFHINSEQNQRQIKIAQLQEELLKLTTSKNELKQKYNQTGQKLKYYESLILEFKGHEISSTQSQSEKINTSRVSSGKAIPLNEVQIENTSKIQLQTLRKKIKLLQNEIERYKSKQEELYNREQQYQTSISQLQQKLKQRQSQISKRTLSLVTKSSLSSTQKPKVQYRTPQKAAQVFRDIQGILKKRTEFHNLESTLIKIYSLNQESFNQENQPSSSNQQIKTLLARLNSLVHNLQTEFQNVKAKIMKLEGRNYQQKAKLISLLKPCEQGLKELLKFAQNSQLSSQQKLIP